MEDGIWIEKDKIIVNMMILKQYTNRLKITNKKDEEIYCGELKEEIKIERFYIDDVLTVYVENENEKWFKYGQVRRKKYISLKRIDKYIREFNMKTEELINECK